MDNRIEWHYSPGICLSRGAPSSNWFGWESNKLWAKFMSSNHEAVTRSCFLPLISMDLMGKDDWHYFHPICQATLIKRKMFQRNHVTERLAVWSRDSSDILGGLPALIRKYRSSMKEQQWPSICMGGIISFVKNVAARESGCPLHTVATSPLQRPQNSALSQ